MSWFRRTPRPRQLEKLHPVRTFRSLDKLKEQQEKINEKKDEKNGRSGIN